MKIREELFDHPDWWQTRWPIEDLNETQDEFSARVDYLTSIEPNPLVTAGNYFSDSQLEFESIDEFRARKRELYLSTDSDVDEKAQDGYYRNEENIKKDMLGSQLPFNKVWYKDFLNRTSAQ
jgi:hypothetical protein